MGTLEYMYEQYSPELHGYISTALRGNKGDAEDIVQTAFLKLVSQPKPEQLENPRAYLFRSVKNLLIDRGRKSQRNNRFSATADNDRNERIDHITPERIAQDRQELKSLEAAILKLPPKQRRVFILRSVHHFSYEKISDETGLSKAGVKQHIVRALASCRAARQLRDSKNPQGMQEKLFNQGTAIAV
ncbi:MAG: RNA polymerase sigma factor [Kordiimonadaceae bacterium]|nr:RNA polymerase sigma factor [Kordiimonadaceae bacterium]